MASGRAADQYRQKAEVLSAGAVEWFQKFNASSPLGEDQIPLWKPKNPACIELYKISKQSKSRSPEQGQCQSEKEDPGELFWSEPIIPFQQTPATVSTHVKTDVWRDLSENITVTKLPGWQRHSELAAEVLDQLSDGATSGVSGAGLLPIHEENHFLEPEMDEPRVLDALLHAIKSGTISGPHKPTQDLTKRINSFLSIPKPDGERRQVGDMSRPEGKSFNCNVDPSLSSCWPMSQLSAKQFSFMVLRMGRDSYMGKSDLSQAYKCIPVTLQQRELQRFQFGNRIFEELRLIFGDTYAPMYFDRFHHVILVVFVMLPNKIPRCIWEKCIDDVPLVVPNNRKYWLESYFLHYRETCEKLGVKVSPTDNSAKSFEAAQSGEVLGVLFNTRTLSWSFPEEKRKKLIRLVRKVIFTDDPWKTREWERILGKLTNMYQLWRPGKLFIDSFIKVVELSRSRGMCKPNRCVRRDAKVWLAALEVGDLPILPPITPPPPAHFQTFSDASGDILDTPSVGILIPAQFGCKPRAVSWEFPRLFLNSVDELGRRGYHKTTCLEAVGMLGTVLLAPDLLLGQSVLHRMDNIATCLAWPRGRSVADSWATTLVRATAHVCAALHINLHTEWQLRRSDRRTEVVDNLSHDRCQGLSVEELEAYLSEGQDSFPSPLLAWMNSPRVDYNLGPQLVEWLRLKYPMVLQA